MTLLVLGLILWIALHAFKRLTPDARARMSSRLGAGPAIGVMAVFLTLATVLMVVGFHGARFTAVYDPPTWGIHLNNLLMLGAVALFGASHSKGRVRTWLRHPMLTAVVVWAVAHLLVNGDLASLLLFGGMGLWALAEMALINAREPVWTRPALGTAAGDLRWGLITLVLFAALVAVHTWLGYWPFPR